MGKKERERRDKNVSARRGGEVCRSVGRSSVLDLRLGRHKWFIPPNCATYGGREDYFGLSLLRGSLFRDSHEEDSV